ncbi:hypothetical protein M5X11_34250 [Paenibacillus alginolyticus]|uniref:hypothetical protein n=1 Tax=Paenibacillus alginolyticus TaxID=59839 RepID=UPI000492887C|nr:hypothetical protein [Paenibacillus alginolyticus]MCY9669916.1 hypothetical protein [Paenibacillus alginolyticus]
MANNQLCKLCGLLTPVTNNGVCESCTEEYAIIYNFIKNKPTATILEISTATKISLKKIN